MATQGECLKCTQTSGEDLSTYQYCFVKFSSGKIVHCDTVGERAFGILLDAPSASDLPCEIAVAGKTKLKVGGALSTVGAPVKVLVTTGRGGAAVLGTTNAAAGGATQALVGSHVMGSTLQASTADGDIIDFMLRPEGLIPTTAS